MKSTDKMKTVVKKMKAQPIQSVTADAIEYVPDDDGNHRVFKAIGVDSMKFGPGMVETKEMEDGTWFKVRPENIGPSSPVVFTFMIEEDGEMKVLSAGKTGAAGMAVGKVQAGPMFGVTQQGDPFGGYGPGQPYIIHSELEVKPGKAYGSDGNPFGNMEGYGSFACGASA